MIHDMKKLVFVIPVYRGGGAEVVSDTLALGLQATGQYDVTILVQKTDPLFMDLARSRGLKIELLPDDLDYFRAGMSSVIGRRLREMEADVAVVTVAMPDKPEIIRKEAPDCRLLFHLHGKPLFEYGRIVDERCGRHPWPMDRLRRLRERITHVYRRHLGYEYKRVYDAVDGYVVLCESYRRDIEKILGLRSADSRVMAMYNPLPVTGADCGSRAEHGKTVLYVGRLSYVDKRPDRLLRIWAGVVPEFPDWCLKIVGDGPYREEMERMVHDLGIAGSVEFCGYAADPSPYYAEASILCLTSEFEGWGMVLAEGQRAGVWPVSFDMCAGVRELVGTDGTRGTLVSPYSEKKYARVLRALMSAPERIAALRPAMMASTDKYSAGEVIAGWDRYLERITARDISGRGS